MSIKISCIGWFRYSKEPSHWDTTSQLPLEQESRYFLSTYNLSFSWEIRIQFNYTPAYLETWVLGVTLNQETVWSKSIFDFSCSKSSYMAGRSLLASRTNTGAGGWYGDFLISQSSWRLWRSSRYFWKEVQYVSKFMRFEPDDEILVV